MARAQCTLDAVEAPLAGAHGVVSIALTSGAGKRWLAIRAQSIRTTGRHAGAERCGLRTHLLGLRRIEVGNDHRALFSLQGGASAVVPVPFVCVGLVGGVLFLGAGASARPHP